MHKVTKHGWVFTWPRIALLVASTVAAVLGLATIGAPVGSAHGTPIWLVLLFFLLWTAILRWPSPKPTRRRA